MILPRVRSTDDLIEAAYVVFDVLNNGILSEIPASVPKEAFDRVIDDGEGWRLVTVSDGYYVFKRIARSS